MSCTATPRSPTRSPAIKTAASWREEIFGNSIIWLPYVDPGFTLAQSLKQALAEHRQRNGQAAVARHSDGESRADRHRRLASCDSRQHQRNSAQDCRSAGRRLGDHVVRPAGFGQRARRTGSQDRARAPRPAWPTPIPARSRSSPSTTRRSLKRSSAPRPARRRRLAGPLTPDQIVYCGSYPLWFEPQADEDEAALVARLRAAIDEHKRRTRFAPKVVLVAGRRPVRRRRRLQAGQHGPRRLSRRRESDGRGDAARRRQLSHRPRATVHRRLGSRVVSAQRFARAAPAADGSRARWPS